MRISTSTLFLLTILIALSQADGLAQVPTTGKDVQVVHPEDTDSWKQVLEKDLHLLGHRNWILVVDKAFPLQNAEGIIYLDTDEPLLDVLAYTLEQIEGARHVKPIIYTDKELGYMTTDLVPGIEKYMESLNGIIPYSSVFLELDCKYWSAGKEAQLRELMGSED